MILWVIWACYDLDSIEAIVRITNQIRSYGI